MDLDPGLLAAIIANPADDLPRLQMADWLDEQGDESRAEFIRVQCELARRPVVAVLEPGYWLRTPDRHVPNLTGQTMYLDGNLVDLAPLQARERELLAKYDREWASFLTIMPPSQAQATRTITLGNRHRWQMDRSVDTIDATSWRDSLQRIEPTGRETVTLTSTSPELGQCRLGEVVDIVLERGDDGSIRVEGAAVIDIQSNYNVTPHINMESRVVFEVWRRSPREIKHEWSRGFVSHITCSEGEWSRHGFALARTTPIEQVTLTNVRANREITEHFVRKNWPAITFTLPSDHRRITYSRFIGEPGLV